MITKTKDLELKKKVKAGCQQIGAAGIGRLKSQAMYREVPKRDLGCLKYFKSSWELIVKIERPFPSTGGNAAKSSSRGGVSK